MEAAQRELSANSTQRNTEVQKELVRLDEGLKGVRAQAKVHNEITMKAQAEVKEQMAQDKASLETMITNSVKELYDGIDRIVNALGLNESTASANNLRDNLKTLADSIASRKEDIKWIRAGVITVVLTALGAIVFAGVKALMVG